MFWPGRFHVLYGPWGCKASIGLSDFVFTFTAVLWHQHLQRVGSPPVWPAERMMTCTLLPCPGLSHSSVLACGIPGMGEPAGLPSMGSHRVGHDLSDAAAAAVLDWGLQGALWRADSGFLSPPTRTSKTSTNLYRALTGLAGFLGWQWIGGHGVSAVYWKQVHNLKAVRGFVLTHCWVL